MRRHPSKWRPRGTELEKAVCFTRRLHPNDAKPVPEGQNSPKNSNGLGFRSFCKGRVGQREADGVRTLAIDREPREADRCVLDDY